MPYTEHKLKSGKVEVTSPHGVKSYGSTKENADKQVRLLHAIDHGFVPTKGKNHFAKRMGMSCLLLMMLLGMLPEKAQAFDRGCYATAAVQSYKEGDSVPCSSGLDGVQRVTPYQKATYSASLTAKTATAAGTGPWFALCGSASKTVSVQKFEAAVTVATAAVYADVVIKKTSSATSAGTPTALTAVPFDSNSAAATVGLVNYYTALATAGTAVGPIVSRQVFAPITGTPAVDVLPLVVNWENRSESQEPILRGTSQCLEASFGTTTTNAPTITVYVVWTEE